MDALGRRAQLMAVTDSAMEHAQKAQRDAALGQHGLFGVFQEDEQNHATEKPLPNIPDWDEHTRLGYEKEILGFFITGHPLEKYHEKLIDFHAMTTVADRRAEVVDRQGRSHDWRRTEGHSRGEVEEGRSLRAGADRRHERLGRHAVFRRRLQAAARRS